jgi:hypothetical protein
MKAQSEAGFTAAVIAYAVLRRWEVAHFRQGRLKRGGWRTPVQGTGKGYQDLTLVRGERIVVSELKMPGNTLTPDQRRWLDAWRATGKAEVYVWVPDDWNTILEVLA